MEARIELRDSGPYVLNCRRHHADCLATDSSLSYERNQFARRDEPFQLIALGYISSLRCSVSNRIAANQLVSIHSRIRITVCIRDHQFNGMSFHCNALGCSYLDAIICFEPNSGGRMLLNNTLSGSICCPFCRWRTVPGRTKAGGVGRDADGTQAQRFRRSRADQCGIGQPRPAT
jgi:hypothetical protein